MHVHHQEKWPKTLSELTAEQRLISDDFMKYWHDVLPRKFRLVEHFNHSYVVKKSPIFLKTLEIGAGIGEHLRHEVLTDDQKQNYYTLEIREVMIRKLRETYPSMHHILGDCQDRVDFEDGFFDRIIAVHVLEHLPNLPAAIREIHRLCSKSGCFLFVIPCEGGFAYSLARIFSAQRIFENRYKQSYKWFIEREHINRPLEIIEEVCKMFSIIDVKYFPFNIPFVNSNLCIGMAAVPK